MFLVIFGCSTLLNTIRKLVNPLVQTIKASSIFINEICNCKNATFIYKNKAYI